MGQLKHIATIKARNDDDISVLITEGNLETWDSPIILRSPWSENIELTAQQAVDLIKALTAALTIVDFDLLTDDSII